MSRHLQQGDVDAMRRKLATQLDITRTRRLQKDGGWDEYKGIPEIRRLLKPIELKSRNNMGAFKS